CHVAVNSWSPRNTISNGAISSRGAERAHRAAVVQFLKLSPEYGGADRDRTGGLLVANEALSQLSYSPTLECGLILTAFSIWTNPTCRRRQSPFRRRLRPCALPALPAVDHAAVYNVEVTSSGSVRQVASADFPTRWGRFRIYGFEASFG